MNKIILLIATIFTTTTMAFTLEHETCEVIIAQGPTYGRHSQYQMPKDYTEKLVKALDKKGYTVTEVFDIGTYRDHPFVFNRANDYDALAIIIRDYYQIIPSGKRRKDHLCGFSIDMRNNNGAMLLRDREYGYESSFFLSQGSYLCNKSFSRMKKDIPKCKKTK